MAKRADQDPDRQLIAAVTLSPETTMLGIEIPPRSGDRVGSLVVIAGAAADVGVHLNVQRECVIGRVGADLHLRDARISRRHARVFVEEEQWWVEDLGSSNGTSIEAGTNAGLAKLPGRAILRDGTRLYLGSTVVKFALIDETEASYLEQISRLAGTDPLTGLQANHRFDSLLEEAARVAGLTRTSLAVLMMDLDGIKAINDQHGHRFGAYAIATVGKALVLALRDEGGEGCRFGGDEFSVYLPGADLVRAHAFAERFRSAVEGCALELDGVPLKVTISIGIAVGSAVPVAGRAGGLVPTELTTAADAAMYRAKAAGKNRVSE